MSTAHGQQFSSGTSVVRCPGCGVLLRAVDAGMSCARCFFDLSEVEPHSFVPGLPEDVGCPAPTAKSVKREEAPKGEGSTGTDACHACGTAMDSEMDALCPSCCTAAPPLLLLVVGNRRERVRPDDTLGRSGTLASDLFSPIPEVSRTHVRLVYTNCGWSVEAVSQSNVTTLDDRVLRAGTKAPLTGRHQLGMSTRCRVVLELPSADGAHRWEDAS